MLNEKTCPRVSPFGPAYWKNAADQLKSVRMLALAGLISALAVALESAPLFLMGFSLRIYFSFLVVSVGAFVYGPVVALLAGMVTDTISFMIFSFGEPYFPGYMITAMLSGMLYGMMLYRQRITVLRLFLTKLVINYAINVALGSVWKAMLYGKAYQVYFVSGLGKNTMLLPLEVLLMVMVFSLLMPALKRGGLIPADSLTDGKIPWF